MGSLFFILTYLILLVHSAILPRTAVPLNDQGTAIGKPTNLSEVLFFQPEYKEVDAAIKQQISSPKRIISFLTKQTSDAGVLFQFKTAHLNAYEYGIAVKTANKLTVFSFPMSSDLLSAARFIEISQAIGITPSNYI